MPTLQSKVTSKGQITLPKQIRSKLAIRTGDRLEFSLEKSNRISVRKKRAPGSSAGCGKRFLQPGREAATVEQMTEGIRKAVSAKYGRMKASGK
jgi:AbrB family looped-hinge helix DNA binding protein